VEPPSARGDEARPRRAFLLALWALTLVGAWLRCRGIASQIPFDDEWHALDFTLSRDAWFIFTHFSRLGANSVPHDLYLRALLSSFGWTETSIVLPSLFSGIALVYCFPRWVARRFGEEAALASALLLAIAPFLVFYSRFARPYAPVLLLEALLVTNLSDWLHTGRPRNALAVVAFGSLALFTHLTAVAPVLGVLGVAVLWRWREARRGTATPGPWRVLRVAVLTVAAGAALSLPSFAHAMQTDALASAHLSSRTLAGVVELLSGTDSAALQWLGLGMCGLGVVLGVRRAPRDLALVAGAALAAVAAVLVGQPLQAEVAAIFTRYALPLFLLSTLAAGIVVQAAVRASRSKRRWALLVGALLALGASLYWAGPLPRIHREPNSFTKHPAWQYGYADPDPTRARPNPLGSGEPGMPASRLHPFYLALSREPGAAPIVEYPFILGQDSNLYYFAQELHGRRVLAGYYPSGASWTDYYGLAFNPVAGSTSTPPPPSRGYILSVLTVDHVLGRAQRLGAVRFSTVVDLSDPAALEQSGAEYVLLHWDLLREQFGVRVERPEHAEAFVARLRAHLAASLGEPVLEDRVVSVFKVR
jgi:hypothetical protein